ncbi:DNA modification methylase [Parvibaculum indicum]|uniref:DNA-methyltransferase n=1 Tax=Parvibaculum indicum TaxID=562969 RepID=UPI001421830A|nr:site-specific DNA-methyltransferase [Parvibaculum indicum]NIJ40367.1 DNA modification methylase [Parvibaculum indicum]
MIDCLNAEVAKSWAAYQGDCVDIVAQMPDGSVDFSVYSPPFSGLYIYNDSIADMGNSADDDEFFEHYRFLARELYRVTRPGRLVAVHCKDLVFYKSQRGTAGLRDFPGELIRVHQEAGFNFHSRVTIWRCPVREMTKTKAHGLLYKQLRADSSFSRQGLPEYLVVFRKWAGEGEGIAPVTHANPENAEELAAESARASERALGAGVELSPEDARRMAGFPLGQWQDYASPVWMDTRETDVLNAHREPDDEKHICPMPLDITTRATMLWSNPGDVVLSPFMGIGSEGVVALRQRRRFIGIELKESYWRQACRYLAHEEQEAAAPTIFDVIEERS